MKTTKSIAITALGLILSACAGEEYNFAPTSIENTFFSGHISFYTETTEDLGKAQVLFEENSYLTSLDDENYILQAQLTANAGMILAKDTIHVENLEVPEIVSDERSEEVCTPSAYTFTGKDIFSDSQSVEISAKWMYKYVQERVDTTFFPSIKIDAVSFKAADASQIDENLAKVTLKYEVAYSYEEQGEPAQKTIYITPYYFQKQIAETELNNKPNSDNTPISSYLTCDTTMIYDGKNASLHMKIWRVNQNLLSKDSVLIDDEKFVVASSGKLGTETLYVDKNYDVVETENVSSAPDQYYTRGKFTIKEKQTIYTWKASFNGKNISVYHQDVVLLRINDISWSDGSTTFDITFDGEIKVVENEMTSKENMGDNYIKTRVLSVETLLEGHRVNTSTGEVILMEHPEN